MRKLQWMMCGVMLAVTACAQAPSDPVAPDDDAVMIEHRSEISSALIGGASTQAETCTTTETACRTGQCELGPRDHFIIITEVCCTSPGVCETEKYKLCGC